MQDISVPTESLMLSVTATHTSFLPHPLLNSWQPLIWFQFRHLSFQEWYIDGIIQYGSFHSPLSLNVILRRPMQIAASLVRFLLLLSKSHGMDGSEFV